MMLKSLLPRVIRRAAVEAAMRLSMADIRYVIDRKLQQESTFEFKDRSLSYMFHGYNNFGMTERSIELPIIKYFWNNTSPKRVLEIGNVTNHYYDYFREMPGKRTVVDKFEYGPYVRNVDIADLNTEEQFDLVISISTFEHMDSDLGRNPTYIPGVSQLGSVAADNVHHVGQSLLEKGGKLVITAPIGYTPEWDWTFYSSVFDACGFSRWQRYVFRRTGELTWRQVPVEQGRNVPMSSYMPQRDYLSVVEFDK